MRPLRWPRTWLGVWFAAIVLVIALSLVPPPPMPLQPPHNFDKLLHLGAYFALAFGATQLFGRWRWLFGIALGLIALGIAMEAAQAALVPHLRMLDPWDALANTVGVVLGTALAATPLAGLLARIERALVERFC